MVLAVTCSVAVDVAAAKVLDCRQRRSVVENNVPVIAGAAAAERETDRDSLD